MASWVAAWRREAQEAERRRAEDLLYGATDEQFTPAEPEQSQAPAPFDWGRVDRGVYDQAIAQELQLLDPAAVETRRVLEGLRFVIRAGGSPELVAPGVVAGPLLDAMEADQLPADVRAVLLEGLAALLGELGQEAAPQPA